LQNFIVLDACFYRFHFLQSLLGRFLQSVHVDAAETPLFANRAAIEQHRGENTLEDGNTFYEDIMPTLLSMFNIPLTL